MIGATSMDYEAARERVKRKIEEKCLLRGVDLPGKGGSRYDKGPL